MARRVEPRTRPRSRPHAPCLRRWGKAGSHAAETSSAASGGRPCRRHGPQPRDPGRGRRRGQRGRESFAQPRVLDPSSPGTFFSQCIVTLRSSMGEGGCRPAPVRQACATGKGFISEAEKHDASLTLSATSPGDWQCGLPRGGLACACANRTWIAVDLPRLVTSSRAVRQSPRPSRSWRKKSSSSCMSWSG
jgi:hypothetical protein